MALVEKDAQFNLVHLKNVHHKLIGNKSRWSLSLSLVTIWTCCIPLNAAAYKRYKSSLLNLFVYTEQMFSKLLIKLWAWFQTRALWRIISSTFFFWLAKLRAVSLILSVENTIFFLFAIDPWSPTLRPSIMTSNGPCCLTNCLKSSSSWHVLLSSFLPWSIVTFCSRQLDSLIISHSSWEISLGAMPHVRWFPQFEHIPISETLLFFHVQE